MSGGHLAVLDRAGREVKQYALPDGLATLGSSTSCDIRFMLPTVEPHHATVVVHDKQTVVHNVGGGETLVNGVAVSVAPLAHGDLLAVGGRELRWRYTRPASHLARHTSLTPAVARMSSVRARVAARRSLGAPACSPRSPHRHSTPAPASERQVAVVQPQRRDVADSIVVSVVTNVTNVRRRGTSRSDKCEEVKVRSRAPRSPPRSEQNTTKASMWIESRKMSPRKQAGARPAHAHRRPRSDTGLLRRALAARTTRTPRTPRTTRTAKIQAPRTVDHMKQAAIMLMTGHTPRKRANTSTPSLVVKRPGATPRSPRSPRSPRTHRYHQPAASRGSAQGDVSNMTPRNEVNASDNSTYSVPDTSLRSPPLPNPKKSALKNSSVNRSTRKVESIKFDLSNLEDAAPEPVDVSALRYSDSSPSPSPSPSTSTSTGRPAHSRSGRILEKTLGTTFTPERSRGASSPPPPSNPNKSTRASLMLHKVLQTPDKSCSYQTTGSLADLSWDTTAPSGHHTRTLSQRNSTEPANKMETYSVIDLVSMDSSDPRSVYSSASDANTSKFATPQSGARRSRRSLLAASTPAPPRLPRTPAASDCFHDTSSLISRRSASDSRLRVPHDATYDISGRGWTRSQLDIENIPQTTLNNTRNTRHRNTPPDHGKKSVARDNDTTKLSSPKNAGDTFNISDKSRSIKSISTLKDSSENVTSNIASYSRISKSRRGQGNGDESSPDSVASSSRRPLRSSRPAGPSSSPPNGMSTPENHNSPEEVSTPVLSIQNLLNSSRNVSRLRASRGASARKTIGGRLSALRKRVSLGSKSFTFGTTAALRSRNAKNASSSPNIEAAPSRDDEDMTPKKPVKLVYEAVKNKHSTAKRPKSIRSVIDDLNDSDIVKQLFNSPVKRKLSQSMIEFSKKQLTDDEITPSRKTTRNTIALTGITSYSPMERTPAITPEVFVSPLTAGGGDERNVSLKLRRWREQTSETTRIHVVAGKNRSTQRKSVKNDLTNVTGIKSLFARSPRNRLSDVRIKELFAASPGNDLRKVPKLRLLFQESPENDPQHVSGVRELYRKGSPANDLRNVSGVRATLRRHSPRNELEDVSGVEELFGESHDTVDDAETSFDLLMGRPAVKAYPRAKSFTAKPIQKPKTRKAQSLLNSFTLINHNVEDWLENELKKRTQKESPRDVRGERDTSARSASEARGRTPRNYLNKSKSKSNLSRELLKLATDTVLGASPVLASRARSTALATTSLLELKKSASEIYGAHTLPIKKRSVAETSRGRSSQGGAHKSSLPIKKRAVQHSTPVRRAHHPHDALDLARVSPIPPLQDDLSARITPIGIPQERKQRKPLQTRNSNVSAAAGHNSNKNVATSNKPSPEQQKITSPMQMRRTRNRKTNQNTEQNNVKKRRTSIVVTKKPPTMSPEPAANHNAELQANTRRRRKLDQVVLETLIPEATEKTVGKRIRAENGANGPKGRNAKASDNPKASPPKTRATRGRKTSAEKVQTPKKMTRSKVLKLTVLVTKPSPNLKTRAVKQNKVNVSDVSPVKHLRRTRKTNANTPEPPVKIANGRGRRGKTVAFAVELTGNKKTKPEDYSLAEPKPRRGRKTIVQKNVQDESKATQVQKRATTNTVNEVVIKRTRGKAALPQEAIEHPKRRVANKSNAESQDRGNKRTTVTKQSPSKLRAANNKGTMKTNRTRISNEESVKSGRRVTKGRQATQEAVGPGDKRQATIHRRGRTTKEASASPGNDAKAPRRRNTSRQPGSAAADRTSKAAAKQKLLTAAPGNDSKKTAAEPRAPTTRKRKADDPAPAKAGPPAAKSRRAAPAAPRTPRPARAPRAPRAPRATRTAPVSQQTAAAARSRRR